jgi:hypothetical protein
LVAQAGIAIEMISCDLFALCDDTRPATGHARARLRSRHGDTGRYNLDELSDSALKLLEEKEL